MPDVIDYETLVRQSADANEAIALKRGAGDFGYYRKPDGTICVDSYQRGEMMTHVEQGWLPLRKYNYFTWSHMTIHKPFDHLFRQGGAKELPIEQLIQERWAYPVWPKGGGHLDYYHVDGKPVEFPQLAGVTLPELKSCPYCEWKGIDRHMTIHIEGTHSKDLMPFRMATALAEANRRQSEPAAVAVKEYTLPFICGVCGSGFNGHMPLAKHYKKEHAANGNNNN